MFSFLKGKKTYLASAGMILGAASAYLTGHMSLHEAIMNGLQGAAMAFLRNAVGDNS